MNYFYVYLTFTFIYLCSGKAVDCELDVIWSNWSPCSKFCGGSGTQFRTRSIVVHPTNGGRPCGLTLQTQSCNTHECVCELSEWTNWSNCSAACGRGKQSRSRTIIRQPDPSLACGETYQERVCGNAVCPIDCELSSWGPWLSCSASCGPGLQSRYRRILTWPSNTGKACGQTKEQKVCQEKACPANCTLSTWSAWSKCNATCGTGEQFRIRTVLNPPHDGGKPCDLTKETKKCEAPIPCCEVSEWSSWSNCTKSCGVGALVRTRKLITKDSKCHGRFNIVETQKCNENPCPVDCLMGPWGEWSMCQEVCKGTQKRTRPVTRAPSNGGKKCLESYEIRNCSCPLQIDTSKEEVDTSHHFVGFAFGLVIGIVMSLSVLFVASYIRYQRKNSRPSVPYFSLGD